MHDPNPLQDRLRRLRAAIGRDEEALRVAREHHNLREVQRLIEDLANRRAYFAELVAQRQRYPDHVQSTEPRGDCP